MKKREKINKWQGRGGKTLGSRIQDSYTNREWPWVSGLREAKIDPLVANEGMQDKFGQFEDSVF